MDDTLVSQTRGTLDMAQIEELHLRHGVRLVETLRPIAQVGHGVDIDRFAKVDTAHIQRGHLHLRNIERHTALSERQR